MPGVRTVALFYPRALSRIMRHAWDTYSGLIPSPGP